MWDLPGPGLEPVSPALAGGFLTPAPPGKPCIRILMRWMQLEFGEDLGMILLNCHFMSLLAFISLLMHLMLLFFNKLKNVKKHQNLHGNYASVHRDWVSWASLTVVPHYHTGYTFRVLSLFFFAYWESYNLYIFNLPFLILYSQIVFLLLFNITRALELECQ